MMDQIQLQEWKKDLEDFVITDIKKSLAANMLETSLIILGLIGTECVSGYFAGKPANQKTFVDFMDKYFPASYVPYSELIYLSLRNGLLHDHTIKTIPAIWKEPPFWLNREQDEPHLVPCKPGQSYPVWFNRHTFAGDFLAAWEKYLSEIAQSEDLRRKLMKRIQTRGYLKVVDTTQL
ncbi:MAG TPA: hypothetical protein VMT24_08455 [Aggregatilineaceae bacterium]|nr:hypothetical protein [Aggregatilineaceae bacterium]